MKNNNLKEQSKVKLGYCEYYDLKKKCIKDICCFKCNDKCLFKNDRCFDDSDKRSKILKGYPERCKFYKDK